MATISASWTENQPLRSAASLAASGTDTNDINLSTNGYDVVTIQTTIVIGSSSGVLVEFFSSADSGTTDDDIAIHSYETSASETRTVAIRDVGYLAVKLTNQDGSNATGNITQIYAGRKWSSV